MSQGSRPRRGRPLDQLNDSCVDHVHENPCETPKLMSTRLADRPARVIHVQEPSFAIIDLHSQCLGDCRECRRRQVVQLGSQLWPATGSTTGGVSCSDVCVVAGPSRGDYKYAIRVRSRSKSTDKPARFNVARRQHPSGVATDTPSASTGPRGVSSTPSNNPAHEFADRRPVSACWAL